MAYPESDDGFVSKGSHCHHPAYNNVFSEGELDEKSNVHFLHIPFSDKPVKVYSLNVIISVGYRVKSIRGTQFRIWATNVLREYLLRGYTFNTRLNQLEDKVDRRLAKHDDRLATIEQKVDFFVQTKELPLQSIFYQNQFWDAKSLLIKFIRRAKKELIVIDAYPGVANGECCQCVNVAVTAPCGGSQPLGTRTRRAKREPSGQFQFPIEEAA